MNNMLKLLLLSCVFMVGCDETTSKEDMLPSAFYSEASQDRVASWELLVGTWYGSQPTENGGSYSWIIKRSDDGQYRLEGKSINSSGVIEKQTEVGEWGVGNGIYFSIFKGWVNGDNFKPSDPTDPYNRDIYRILELNENVMRYEHLDHGIKFTARKVENDFQFPN